MFLRTSTGIQGNWSLFWIPESQMAVNLSWHTPTFPITTNACSVWREIKYLMKSETREYNDKLQAHHHSNSPSEVLKSVSGDEAFILILIGRLSLLYQYIGWKIEIKRKRRKVPLQIYSALRNNLLITCNQWISWN